MRTPMLTNQPGKFIFVGFETCWTTFILCYLVTGPIGGLVTLAHLTWCTLLSSIPLALSCNCCQSTAWTP